MTRTKFDENRCFGVEIEAVGVYPSQVAEAMSDNNIECHSEHYNHTTRPYWKIVSDSSLRDNTGAGKTFELVSPKLKGKQGLEEIEKVCGVLQSIGAKINKSCGLHVHHDAADFTAKNFRNLFALYGKMEQTLDRMMPASRRYNNNYMCKSISKTMRNGLEEFKACETIEDYKNWFLIFGDRHSKLNIHSYWIHGSIEFRHHSGTIEAEKITNWVVMTQIMMNRAKTTVRINLEENRYETNPLISNWSRVACDLTLKREWNTCDTYVQTAVRWAMNRINHFEQKALEQAA